MDTFLHDGQKANANGNHKKKQRYNSSWRWSKKSLVIVLYHRSQGKEQNSLESSKTEKAALTLCGISQGQDSFFAILSQSGENPANLFLFPIRGRWIFESWMILAFFISWRIYMMGAQIIRNSSSCFPSTSNLIILARFYHSKNS